MSGGHGTTHPNTASMSVTVRFPRSAASLRAVHATILLTSLSACSSSATPKSTASDASASSLADSITRAHQDSVNRAQPGYIVDSILPPAEALRRFLADVATPPNELANGADSRDALVRKWVQAIEANDSLTLVRTALNRPEFAYLVYPASPSAHQPSYQPPTIVWGELSNKSVKGFRRSLNRYGGKPLGYLGYRCESNPKLQAENRLWTDCLVRRVRAPGDTVSERLFGAIIERNGRFKFYSLANDI